MYIVICGITWWTLWYARWCELDDFIVKKCERQRMMKRMWTMSDGALSDQIPICLQVNAKKRRSGRGVNDLIRGMRYMMLYSVFPIDHRLWAHERALSSGSRHVDKIRVKGG